MSGRINLVDSHFHIFRRALTKQTGILGAPYLQRDFLWTDYLEASRQAEVSGSVMVQVNEVTDPLLEAGWVSSVAAAEGGPSAIIGYAQLESPVRVQQIAALRTLPLVRGVRRNAQLEDSRFCARPEYAAGARLLGAAGLVCEICVRAHQLEAVSELAEACPGTTFVLNHLGKPDLAGDLRPWRAAIARLARSPNVLCKVSVVVHSHRDPRLTRELAEPLVAGAIECFGWDRVMFGSNWPVALAVTGYQDWVEILVSILARERESDLRSLFASTATRVYGLG